MHKDLKVSPKEMFDFARGNDREDAYEKLAEKANEAERRALALEKDGGPCPLCGIPFVLHEAKYTFGEFNFYLPGCECFPKCERVTLRSGASIPGCGRYLIAEKLQGTNACSACASALKGTSETQEKQAPVATAPQKREYRALKRDGKFAASGEGRE